MEKDPHRKFQVSPATAIKVSKYATTLDCSSNQFAERAISALIELIETPPQSRKVPKIVLLVDAMNRLEGSGFAYPASNVPTASLNERTK